MCPWSPNTFCAILTLTARIKRDQEHQHREKEAEAAQVAEETQQLRTKAGENRDHLGRLQANLQELDSQRGQLLNRLKRFNPDAARGWEWLADNQAEFQQEVFGPPMLSCSVNDVRYTDLVQSMLQADDFLCFTAQNRDDHKKLSDQFYGKMGLSVTIRSCFTPYSSFRPPLPKEELTKLGFDGYVKDYLEGPEPVLAMLCSEKRLHTSAVALKDISDEQFDRIQQMDHPTQFAAGKQFYRITRRREYGPTAVSTRVTQFGRGRFWTDQPVDVAEKEELFRKIEELKRQRAEMREQFEARQARKNDIDQEKEQIAKKMVCSTPPPTWERASLREDYSWSCGRQRVSCSASSRSGNPCRTR